MDAATDNDARGRTTVPVAVIVRKMLVAEGVDVP
jgi:hypothetical protein